MLPDDDVAVRRLVVRTTDFDVAHKTMEFFPLDVPVDIRWRGDCAQMCLDFPRIALEQRLEQHLDRPLNGPLVFSPAMDLTTPKGRSWSRMLRLANREARREQGLLDHPLAAKSVEAALVDGLLLAQPHNYSAALLHDPRIAPPRAVREAVELLETYPDRAWSAPALASHVHVSVRALQQGFRRSLDTTPTRHLREVRLRKVREDLLAATPDVTTVGAIVHRWGILNQGPIRRSLSSEVRRSPVGHPSRATGHSFLSRHPYFGRTRTAGPQSTREFHRQVHMRLRHSAQQAPAEGRESPPFSRASAPRGCAVALSGEK